MAYIELTIFQVEICATNFKLIKLKLQIKMVLSAAETTAFFQGATNMAIPTATRVAMQQEGITAVEDLAAFTDDDLKLIADNLRKLPAGLPIPVPVREVFLREQPSPHQSLRLVLNHSYALRLLVIL